MTIKAQTGVFAMVMALAGVCAADAPALVTSTCASCHTETGNSTKTDVPKIAGLTEGYLHNQIDAMTEGQRAGNKTCAAAAGLSNEDINTVTHYFSSQRPSRGQVLDAKLAAAGKVLYGTEDSDAFPPTCANCHGDKGEGSTRYPRIGGQHQAYMVAQLRDFHDGKRKGYDKMTALAKNLDPEKMTALAEHIASLVVGDEQQ